MRHGRILVLCAVCCAAVGAWGADGRSSVSPRAWDAVGVFPIPKADVAAIFTAADVNRDGRLTFGEARSYSFLVTQELFDQYDTDSNGYIDRAEAGLPPATIDFEQLFDAADKDGDGRVTFSEAYAANHMITQTQFDSYDANEDGCLDRAEVGLSPVDPGKGGCDGCSSGKSRPAGGDLFTMALSLLGLAVMAKAGRR